MNVTLNQIKARSPCTSGWKKLLKHLGKTQPDDDPLSLITILGSNGFADALWCLRAVEGYDKEIRMFGVWCAREVQHLMTDQRSLDALDVAERFAHGLATADELDAAGGAAWAAVRDAAWAASAAARAVSAVSAARNVSAAAWAADAASAVSADAWAADAASAVSAASDAWAAARQKQEDKFIEVFGEPE